MCKLHFPPTETDAQARHRFSPRTHTSAQRGHCITHYNPHKVHMKISVTVHMPNCKWIGATGEKHCPRASSNRNSQNMDTFNTQKSVAIRTKKLKLQLKFTFKPTGYFCFSFSLAYHLSALLRNRLDYAS